jgi:hypothetical protein
VGPTKEAVIDSVRDHIKKRLERMSLSTTSSATRAKEERHGEQPRILFAKTTAASHTQKRREGLEKQTPPQGNHQKSTEERW